MIVIAGVRIKKEHTFHYLLRVTTDGRIWYTQNKVHSNDKILAKQFPQNYQRKIDEILCSSVRFIRQWMLDILKIKIIFLGLCFVLSKDHLINYTRITQIGVVLA